MSEDKIIDKIRKLLALAKSSNEHEAALAAARAAELMLLHQISEAKLSTAATTTELEEVVEQSIGHDKNCIMWKGLIARALANSLGCEMIFQTRYVNKQTKFGDTVALKAEKATFTNIIGKQTAIQTVEYLFAYLVREIDRLAVEGYDPERDPEYQRAERLGKHFSHRSHAARRWKEAFRSGASSVVCVRLESLREDTFEKARTHANRSAATGAQADKALARVDTAIAKVNTDIDRARDFLKNRKVKNINQRTEVRADGFGEGAKAGHGINLHGGRALSEGNKQIKE